MATRTLSCVCDGVGAGVEGRLSSRDSGANTAFLPSPFKNESRGNFSYRGMRPFGERHSFQHALKRSNASPRKPSLYLKYGC